MLTKLRRLMGGHEPDAQPHVWAGAPHIASLTPTGQQLTREGVLEEFLRDLLRPIIEQWLQENLAGLVRRVVQEETARRKRVSNDGPQDESFARMVALLALRRRGR